VAGKQGDQTAFGYCAAEPIPSFGTSLKERFVLPELLHILSSFL
jgi:hypothetical protein